jgi:hypothetical protein
MLPLVDHESKYRKYQANPFGNRTVTIVPAACDEVKSMSPPCAETTARDEQPQADAVAGRVGVSAGQRLEDKGQRIGGNRRTAIVDGQRYLGSPVQVPVG